MSLHKRCGLFWGYSCMILDYFHSILCSSITLMRVNDMRYIIWVLRLFYDLTMFFISCLEWLFCLCVQRTEVGIPSSSRCRHHCCQICSLLFFKKKNLKSWICANSVICFANNLYFVTTEHFCYKVCFFADLGKGIPFISGTFFFDVMFNSLLPMTTFCVVWTDCSCNISFPVDCSLLRGYFFLQMYRINVHCAKQRVCSWKFTS